MSLTPTLTALRENLRSGDTTPPEIIRSLSKRIEMEDETIQAYVSISLENALKEAESADLSKPLGGLPIALKDNLNTAGEPCTCGSLFLRNSYISPYDSTVSKKLKDAGAILFGRTNMDEFAMGSATENSAIQLTRNPHDTERIVGGSSGGSAAAVAAGTAFAALGSDTGGSIRQPASHCGVVGLKPSYGRVSRYGLVAFASSLDQIGPLTRSVDDAALILQTIAGNDPLDSTSADIPVPDYAQKSMRASMASASGFPLNTLRTGFIPEFVKMLKNVFNCLQIRVRKSFQFPYQTLPTRSQPTMSSPPLRHPRTFPDSMASATETGLRNPRTSRISTTSHANAASDPRSNAASSWEPTFSHPATTTPTTAGPRKSAN